MDKMLTIIETVAMILAFAMIVIYLDKNDDGNGEDGKGGGDGSEDSED